MKFPPAHSLLTLVLIFAGAHAVAAQTIYFDASACRNDRLFGHGFGEDADVPRGLLTRVFSNRTYYLVVPASYRADTPMPLLMALHGTGGSPAAAQTNAEAIAQIWAPIARTRGMLVAVPIGSSAMGSWSPPADLGYVEALRAQLTTEFNVDARRNYLWGFSAGGHFGHGLVLQRTDLYAAYAVAAGVLRGYVGPDTADCPQYLAAVPRRLPIDISSGTSDSVVPISEISADEGRFRNAGWVTNANQGVVNLWVRGITGQQHTYTSEQLMESWDRICLYGVMPD